MDLLYSTTNIYEINKIQYLLKKKSSMHDVKLWKEYNEEYVDWKKILLHVGIMGIVRSQVAFV